MRLTVQPYDVKFTGAESPVGGEEIPYLNIAARLSQISDCRIFRIMLLYANIYVRVPTIYNETVDTVWKYDSNAMENGTLRIERTYGFVSFIWKISLKPVINTNRIQRCTIDGTLIYAICMENGGHFQLKTAHDPFQ